MNQEEEEEDRKTMNVKRENHTVIAAHTVIDMA